MRSDKAVSWTSLVWLPLAFALTLPAYLANQNFFRATGPAFLLIRALPFFGAAAVAYSLWLRPAMRRYELLLLLLFPAAVCCASEPRACLTVVSLALAAFVLGDCFTAAMRFESRDAPVVWSLGFGILILIGIALGEAGILMPAAILPLLGLCLCRAFFVRRKIGDWLAAPFRTWRAGAELASPVTGVAVFFVVLFTGCSLLLALSPVTAFDVLQYHFPLAQHYAQTHSLEPVHFIRESYFPQGAEVLMAYAFALGGEPAARLLLPLLGVLYLWLLLRVARACGLNRSAAVAGASVAATFPFLQWTFSVPKNDSAFSLFQLGALYSLLAWREGRGTRWLLLSAFLLGQSAGVKHVALFGMVALFPLLVWAWMREMFSLRVIALMTLLFAGSGLFSHFQNLRLRGNPIFPSGSAVASQTPIEKHGRSFTQAAERYATLPWYLLFHGQKAFESLSPNPLGMFCLLYFPVVIVMAWRARWSPARKACFCFVAVYLVFWCTVLSTLRYAIVPFSLIGLAIGACLVRLADTSQGPKRTAAVGLTAYGFLFSLLVTLGIETNSLQAAYLLKRIGPEEYLREAIPAIEPLLLLARISPHASAFGVDVCSRYYAPDPLNFSCVLCDDGCQLNDVLVPLGSRQFEFAILPARAEFEAFRRAIVANYGATVIDDDGKFVILRLSPEYAPHAD